MLLLQTDPSRTDSDHPTDSPDPPSPTPLIFRLYETVFFTVTLRVGGHIVAVELNCTVLVLVLRYSEVTK